MEPILEARSIKKYYPIKQGLFSLQTDYVKAVDSVNLSIEQGETLGLVGESGCGKSTIVKLLLMLEDLTAGEILSHGKAVSDFNASDLMEYRRTVQVVFQNPYASLNPRMRVRDIISEPLRAVGKPPARVLKKEVEEALITVGLDPDAASKFPHEFSGGQRQRIAIARALTSRPRLIILDEPISSQDVSIQAQLLNLLKDLQEGLNVSFLFIGHDLATVRFISDRIMVMYLGAVVESADADLICTKPLHPYTKALLSASLPYRPNPKRERNILAGEVPSPLNPPTGCPFHTRCPVAMPQCVHIKPELKEIEPNHTVACLLYEENA